MGKNKKKRHKEYRGADAANTKPNITRISAVNRSRFSQWWFEKKRAVKPALKIIGVTIVVAIIIFEIIRILSGNGF